MRGAAVGVKDGLPAKLEAQTTYFDPKPDRKCLLKGQQPRPPESTVKQDLGGISTDNDQPDGNGHDRWWLRKNFLTRQIFPDFIKFQSVWVPARASTFLTGRP